MRVYPPVSKQEAATYLTAQAKLIWGDETPLSADTIETVAEAMSMVSAIDVPEETEPLFP